MIYIKITLFFLICREYVPYRSQPNFLLEQEEWKRSLDGPEKYHILARLMN